MPEFHLAQLNVARAVAQLDSATMADFMDSLDEINTLGESSPGFVWRLKSDSGNATDIKISDNPLFIINLTVWESVDALFEFVYRTHHKDYFARRFDWFERYGAPSVVLWWISAGTFPTADEAMRRLARLTDNGPTPDAFTFKQRFDPPSADGVAA